MYTETKQSISSLINANHFILKLWSHYLLWNSVTASWITYVWTHISQPVSDRQGWTHNYLKALIVLQPRPKKWLSFGVSGHEKYTKPIWYEIVP